MVAIYALNISQIMRSHELYKNDVAHDMHANFTKKFRERYLTSNAYITVTDAQNKSQTVPIGCKSLLLMILIILTRGQGNMRSSKHGSEYLFSLDLSVSLSAKNEIAEAGALQLLV